MCNDKKAIKEMRANDMTPAFPTHPGVNAEPLLKMQMRYNLQSTKNDSTFMARLAKVRRVAAAL